MGKQQSIKITFLGTGTSTGVPMISSKNPIRYSEDKRDKRLRASVLVSYGKDNYVIDCGPDFRQQMLRANVEEIKGIYFTHEHADHIAGLDDVRPYYYRMGEVPIFTSERVLKSLQRRYEYIFATENRYPSAPAVAPTIISKDSVLKDNGLTILPIEILHGDLPILGYRFNNVAYLTDVKTIPEAEKQKLQNLDVLIITALRKEPHKTHFNLEEALSMVKELQPKRAYLSHISELLGFHADIEKELPKNVFLAYDELVIEVE